MGYRKAGLPENLVRGLNLWSHSFIGSYLCRLRGNVVLALGITETRKWCDLSRSDQESLPALSFLLLGTSPVWFSPRRLLRLDNSRSCRMFPVPLLDPLLESRDLIKKVRNIVVAR